MHILLYYIKSFTIFLLYYIFLTILLLVWTSELWVQSHKVGYNFKRRTSLSLSISPEEYILSSDLNIWNHSCGHWRSPGISRGPSFNLLTAFDTFQARLRNRLHRNQHMRTYQKLFNSFPMNAKFSMVFELCELVSSTVNLICSNISTNGT